MKVQDLFESSFKSEVTYKGKVLKATLRDGGYDGTIDGKQITTRRGTTLADMTTVMNALRHEVDGAGQSKEPPEGLNLNETIQRLKQFFSVSRSNGWHLYSVEKGNRFGKNKSKAFTIEFDKTIKADKKDTGKHFPLRHVFLIQASFELEGNTDDKVIIWLKQGGQIITVGLPAFKFTQGDLKSFEAALKKAMKLDDSSIIDTLYKSGYHTYGRE